MADDRRPWSGATLAAFRFAFCYLALYCCPSPQGAIPGTGWLSERWRELWVAPVRWAAAGVFGIQPPFVLEETGSGDRVFDYVLAALFLALAALAAAVWTAFDRRREHTALHHALRTYVRLCLAFSVFDYGLFKFFDNGQFAPPAAGRLVQPFGDASPMGLLWTFMGYSYGYRVFAGLTEVLGPVLLLFRRTTTLGALITTAVMGHVFVLNLCFDVPVKLFSFHLVLMSVFLLLPDAARLFRFLVLNEAVPAADLGPRFADRRLRWAAAAAPVLLIAGEAAIQAQGISAFGAEVESDRNPLKGFWAVERGGLGWRRVMVSSSHAMAVQLDDLSLRRFFTRTDVQKGTVEMQPRDAPDRKSTLRFERPDPDHLVLRGPLVDADVDVTLRRLPPPEFRLYSRPFRWVTEYPYNY